MAAPNLFERILSKHTLKSFLKDRHTELVYLRSSDPVEKALKVLCEHHILSAPVRFEDAGDFCGLIDMMDILSAIIRLYTAGTNSVAAADWQEWCKDIETLDHRGVRFGIMPVAKLINQSEGNPFLPVSEHGTFFQLAEELFARGVHRAPVSDDHGKILGIVSQSDVIALLAKSPEFLTDPLASKTISELGVIDKEFLSVTVDTPAIHAFYLMSLNKESCLSIVSRETGAVLGNLSVADLRSLPQQRFSSLLDPVSDFISHRMSVVAPGHAHVTLQTRRPAMTVLISAELGAVVQLMASHHIHQVWVVDEHQKPVGLVRTSTLIALATRT
eukprot:m.41545 g.41545  ORF g.41545 m.41545 type:complete len:330 (+) comp10517_c0_seq1:100-1089(+)